MPDWHPFGRHRETVVVVVDDRTLVLGLDHLYRDAMAGEDVWTTTRYRARHLRLT